ncbi:MAG: hypothetical protein COA42_17895, partial [Alteromonadaceae bacterium]
DYIIAFFACLYAGVIAVPAFPPSARRRDWGRIDAIFKNADPALVLTVEALQENIIHWQVEQNMAPHVAVVASDQLGGNDAGLWQRPISRADTVAFLQYSSGSTGTPKGVMVTHENVRHNLGVISDGFSLTPQDRGASWLPIYHDMGLIGSILEPFNKGLSIYLMSPLDVLQKPLRWLKAISDFKVTASGGPNFIYEHCINRIKEDEKVGLDLSSWELAFNGAEPISRDTLERFSRAFESCGFNPSAHTPCYGMAETTLMVSSCTRNKHFSYITQNEKRNKTSVVCSGDVHPDFRVKIVNPDTQIECADGQTGEIWLQGDSVAKGYWQQEALTQQTFHAKVIGDVTDYLRTGDLGFKQGLSLYVTGRIKELIIIRGQNHYPQDIEASVANSCKELSGCFGATFSVDIGGAERLIVVHEISRHHMRNFNGETILADVRRAVAEHHQLQLHSLVLIKPASLLRTTSGKIRRVAMADAFLSHELNTVFQWSLDARHETNHEKMNTQERDVPQKEGEAITAVCDSEKVQTFNIWIQDWIAKRLQMSPNEVAITEGFVSFGLDSVDAVELTHDLSTEFGIAVKADLAWVYPNISAASDYLITLLDAKTETPTQVKDNKVEQKWLEGEI